MIRSQGIMLVAIIALTIDPRIRCCPRPIPFHRRSIEGTHRDRAVWTRRSTREGDDHKKRPPKKGRQVMAALPHRSLDLARQNSEMFSQPCEQLPLFLVGSQISDHLALGYLHAEPLQVGLHVLHRTVRLLRQSTRGLINDWRSLQVRRIGAI
jgi:hypothetical protein